MTDLEYNPWRLPWPCIVNYLSNDISDVEIALVAEKIKQQYREFGPNSIALVLDEVLRLDRARPELLLVVIHATQEYRWEINGWQAFKDRCFKAMTSRGHKNLIG